MKWSDEQTNRVGQLALVGKASKWVEYLTLNDSGSLATNLRRPSLRDSTRHKVYWKRNV